MQQPNATRSRQDDLTTGGKSDGATYNAAPARPGVPLRRRDKLAKRSARLGYLLTAPAFVIIGVVTLFPVLFSIFISLNTVTLGLHGLQYSWAGLANYSLVVKSSLMHYALSFTAGYTAVSVLVELVLGVAVAVVLDRMTAGRPVVLALLLVPWAMITVISAELWGYIFNGAYGVANGILVDLHIISQPISFLSSPLSAMAVLMLADVWKTTPFVAIIVLGGLQLIDRDLYAAAAVDGANALKTFLRITAPLLKPAIVTAGVFRVLQAFGLFDLPFVLTSGGPGHSTESVAVVAYNAMFQNLDFGAGSAVASITALLVIIVAVFLIKVFRFSQDVGA